MKILGGDFKLEGISGDSSLDRRTGAIVRRFSLVYRVQASAEDLDQEELERNGLGVSQGLGSTFNGATCVRVSFDEVDTPTEQWDVTFEYDSSAEPQEPDDEEPEDLRPKWWWEGDSEEELLEQDLDEKPIENSMKEPIPVMVPMVRPILNVERYELTFSPDTILNYVNYVNKTTFWGAPKGCAWMINIYDREAIVSGRKLRLVRYVIKFKMKKKAEGGGFQEDTWQLKLRNRATKYKTKVLRPDGSESLVEMIFQDAPGNPTLGDIDKDGYPIDKDLRGPIVGPGDGKIVYLDFKRFGDADFNSLNLGPFN